MNDVLLKGRAYSVLDSLNISSSDYKIIKKEYFSDFKDLDLGNMILIEKLNSSNIPNNLKEKYKDYLLNYYKYREYNKELLYLIKELKNNNYNIYILSDNNKEAISYYKSLDLFKYIDGWVVSYEYKTMKEDKIIFKILLEKYKLNSKECLYIDDRIINVDIAKSLGIKAFKYSFLNDSVNDLINNIKKEIV